MHYTITKAQIEQVIDAIEDQTSYYTGEFSAAVDMLQGLLAQPEQEPVAYQWKCAFTKNKWMEVTKEEYHIAAQTNDVLSGSGSVRVLYAHLPPSSVTDEMVGAYLTAQRATVEEADRLWGRPNVGGLHTNTVKAACRAGLVAALNTNTNPAPFVPITADDVTDEMVKEYDRLCYDEDATPKQHLAAVINAWGAKK